MVEWFIGRQVLVGWIRLPITWLVALLALGGSRALERWLPLGLTTEDVQRLSAHYEIAFISGGIGAVTACAHMRHYATLTRSIPPLRRMAMQLMVLLLAAAATAAPIVICAHHLQTWQLGTFNTRGALAGLVLGWTQFACMAMVVLELGREKARSHHVALLALLGGAVLGCRPLLDGAGWLGARLALVLDAAAPLRDSFASPGIHASQGNGGDFSLAALCLGRVLPIVMFGLLSVALASPRTPRQTPTHALRDPR